MLLIDGKKIAEQITKDLDLTDKTLAVVLAGDDPASELYVKRKKALIEKLGGQVLIARPSAQADPSKVIADIQALNQRADGVMVQLPLPEPMRAHTTQILEAIDPAVDVDGLSPASSFIAPTAAAVAQAVNAAVPLASAGGLAESEGLNAKQVVVLARSQEFVQAVARALEAESAAAKGSAAYEVVQQESFDPDSDAVSEYDIVIAALGQAGAVAANHIKEGAICIDVGITEVAGRIRGDFHTNINQKAAAKTPVPGGVGPITVACLAKNLSLT